MNWNELKKFCSTERDFLKIPYVSENGISYATDGHLVVSSKIDIPADHKNHAWFSENHETRAGFMISNCHKEPKEWVTIRQWPDKMTIEEECEKCEGTGICDCSECGHKNECLECYGDGKTKTFIYFKINGIIFKGDLLEKIKTLKGLEFGLFLDKPMDAARFKFEGGDGCIMPSRVSEITASAQELEIA